MLEVKPVISQQSMTISTQYPIISTRYPTMAIGAEDKVNGCDILTAFFQSAGGKMSAIGIVPCASSQEPSIVSDRYVITQLPLSIRES